ncbi:hypothetical protein [Sphingomicrobium nitratireducens]|uniref:M61 family metallopeptidase n=1 Tax=Sphingomicrobium nitratireducens TaxID=2964666 RepID=UPI00223E9CA5|nr:hypothetical protein [Sphingomicrobium nitratireducens]
MNRAKMAIVASAIVAGASSPALAVEECREPVARYDVRYAGDDRFEVAARFSSPSSRWDLAHFPTPDRPEAQSASIRSLRAFDKAGTPIPLAYVGEGTFETNDKAGASAIRYEVIADHDLADWNIGAPGKDEVAAHFDTSYLFAGHAFFLLDWDMKRCAVEIHFDLPPDWHVTTPWREVDGHYLVEDSWALGQNMFAMGRDRAEQVDVGGLRLNWLMDSALAPVTGEVRDLLSILPERYTALWGASPGSKFSVFLMSDTMSDGGAFWNSFALRFAVPLSEADRISWRHTLGHEVMHLWNGLGKAKGENVPELEWVNEGFTDYLTLREMSRAGLIDPDMTEQRLANIVRRYMLAGRLTPGVTLKSSGADKGANWHAVYGGGAMVALLLDAELSREDDEAFARMLRALSSQQGEGYDYDRFVDVLDRESGGKARNIITWIDRRPSGGEIVQRFAALGLDVSIFGVDEAYVRFAQCPSGRCPPPFLRREP